MTNCKNRDEIAYSSDPYENIKFLWETIDTKYCFIEEKGINWNDIGDEYKEKAKHIPNDQIALFDLCSAMLDSLKDGHVNLYTDFDVSRTDYKEDYKKNYNADIQKLYLKNYRIAGGLYYCVLENQNIGYIAYPSFEMSISNSNLAWISEQFKNCDGLILDLRENGGGNLNYAYTLSSFFYNEDVLIGYWQHKTGKGHNDFSELKELKIKQKLTTHKWNKKTIVLINRTCYSATNFCINCLKGHGNIVIIGDKSGGGGGMPMSYEMPCGWMVRFSSIKILNKNKESIENGIEPNIYVEMTSNDKDDIIEKAIELIKNPSW